MIFISFRRKYAQVFIVISLVFLITFSFLHSSWIISQETNNLIKSKLSNLNHFDLITTKIFKSNNDSDDDDLNTLDPESHFNQVIQSIFDKKLEADIENKFWLSDTHIRNEDYELNIPSFYYDLKIKPKDRPEIQPFDPRFTIAIYYHWLKTSLTKKPKELVEAPFHWYDWVDLSVLNKYLLAPPTEKPDCSILDARNGQQNQKRDDASETLDPKVYCLPDLEIPYNHDDGNKFHPGFNVFQPTGRTSPEKALISGKSYLYSYAPPPAMIIFLTKDGSYNLTTTKRVKLLDSALVNTYMSNTHKFTINSHDELNSLQKKVPSNKDEVIDKYEVEIPESDFTLPTKNILAGFQERMHSGKRLTKQELKYYQSLKYSEYSVNHGGPPKYFSEARLLGTTIGDHYDWRFFNGVMYGTYEQTLILHRLVRTFLSFTRKNGITTWVAHGSLLSWYWNGIAFPWDNDIDVQVPVMDLHKLSLNFNQSLVVEDNEDGFGRYFLDCGSFITLRERGNGNNNIDARFIDIDSGLYIDITGLSISDTNPPDRYNGNLPEKYVKATESNLKTNQILKVYNCRNNHFSSLNELSPLVKTYIEGEIGYVPKKYTDILAVEYTKGLLTKKFSGYVFLPQLRLWIKEEDLYYFLNDKEKWKNYHNFNENYLQSMNSDSTDFEDKSYELTSEEKLSLKKEAEAREKQGKDSHNQKLQLTDDDLLTVLKFSYDELIELLTKDELLMDFITTRDLTSLHEDEIMNLLFGKSTEKIINGAPDFTPIKYDPFLYYIKNEYVNYDDEVVKYLDLLETYKMNDAKHQDELIKASGKIINPDDDSTKVNNNEDDESNDTAAKISIPDA